LAAQARNTEAERRACEIRLRAERKAGDLLSQMERGEAGRPANGGNAGRNSSPYQNSRHNGGGFDRPQTLNQMGISEHQSRRWQQLADVPASQFEAALAGPEKPSTNGGFFFSTILRFP
jgi:hypothetical protein